MKEGGVFRIGGITLSHAVSCVCVCIAKPRWARSMSKRPFPIEKASYLYKKKKRYDEFTFWGRGGWDLSEVSMYVGR